eukprot:CAMPEP_0184706136 /NCGR_PEP_ID=MMETSP0313-20130426/36605_1 /TAXON_ID=2792 /ORGANISM="Porphyridium aerugineum, Strain SAG 1380-2" /LENGTH=668 /DNA_ID=CAMNT_0027167683 /DNA_START=686 /DNA_END=2693 /DNA_ORIENTATION=+
MARSWTSIKTHGMHSIHGYSNPIKYVPIISRIQQRFHGNHSKEASNTNDPAKLKVKQHGDRANMPILSLQQVTLQQVHKKIGPLAELLKLDPMQMAWERDPKLPNTKDTELDGHGFYYNPNHSLLNPKIGVPLRIRIPKFAMETLLQTENRELKEALLLYADLISDRHFGNKVFYRGIVEFSNVCQKNCGYCGIRKSMPMDLVERYTMKREEVMECAKYCFERGYGTIMLQSGELNTEKRIGWLQDMVREIRDMTVKMDASESKDGDIMKKGLCVALSVGELEKESYQKLFDAGARRYLLRIESSNPDLYAKLHPRDHSHAKRMECLQTLKNVGFQLGTGIMVALPHQKFADLANDIYFFETMNADMIGCGPYVYQANTPVGDVFLKKMTSEETWDDGTVLSTLFKRSKAMEEKRQQDLEKRIAAGLVSSNTTKNQSASATDSNNYNNSSDAESSLVSAGSHHDEDGGHSSDEEAMEPNTTKNQSASATDSNNNNNNNNNNSSDAESSLVSAGSHHDEDGGHSSDEEAMEPTPLSPSFKENLLDLTMRFYAVTRIHLGNVNIPATTALQSLDPIGRERALHTGANILMPIITPKEYRLNYKLYQGKPCIDENASECHACLSQRVHYAQKQLVLYEFGDPPHFLDPLTEAGRGPIPKEVAAAAAQQQHP